ncbi:MAG: response regulator transcription factor, partial [Candidatus Kapaibacterium sp.]
SADDIPLHFLWGSPVFTDREHGIVQHLARGLSCKEIAALLYLSTETVRRHIHNIYRKLRVRNRTEALVVLNGKPKETSAKRREKE